jgi:hypothetical protein
MFLQTSAVAGQWLISDHVVTPTYTNASIALQLTNVVFYVVCVDML